MYNYASLLAEEYTLRRLLSKGLSVEETTTGLFRIKCGSEAFYINVDKQPDKSVERLLRNSSTLEARSSLLQRDLPELDDTTRLGITFLEDNLGPHINGECFWGGKISFRYKLHHLSLEVDEDLVWHEYEVLTLNKSLREGYQFTEVVGSHFLVKTPNGRIRVTTLKNCDCPDFHRHKNCLHLRSVLGITSHRADTGVLRVLRMNG